MWPAPAHTPYVWHDLPDDSTPVDAEHLIAAEDDLAAYTQQVGQMLGLGPTTVQTSAYSAQPGDFVPVNAAANSVAITLPTIPLDGSRVGVKVVGISGSFNVTVNCPAGATFNVTGGSTSITLVLAGQGILLQYAATPNLWYVTADDLPLSSLDSRYTQIGAGVASFNGRTGMVQPATADYYGIVAAALSGATAAARFVGATASGAPASGTFLLGDFVIAQNGVIWVCTAAGSPGTWTNAGSSAGVSSFNGRTGTVAPASADYTAAQVTNAADKSSGSAQSFTGAVTSAGLVTGTALVPSGLTGATAATRFVGGTTSGAPASGTFATGDFVIDQSGKVWICTAGGTSGTWTTPSGNLGSSLAYTASPITTSSTSMVSVAGINFAVGASQAWKFEFESWISAPSSSFGALFQLTGPSSPTLVNVNVSGSVGGTSSTEPVASNMTAFSSASANAYPSPGNAGIVRISGVVVTGVNAGTVQLQWAMQPGGGSIALGAGAFLDARRIS